MPSLFLQGRFFTGLFLTLFPLQTIIRKYASVAELVDAQDLGSCALCMGVRVPSLAPKKALWISQCFFIGNHFFR